MPFGLVGGRLYHVITDPSAYFGEGGDPIKALYVWQGGLGIWGAIALGGVGAWIGCRRYGHQAAADGRRAGARHRGRPGDRPLGQLVQPGALRQADRPAVGAGDRPGAPAVARPAYQQYATFHPTFLYECAGTSASPALVIWADRRFRLGHGRAFALYVMAYTAGRGWIEYLRIDAVEANHVFGLRLNVWTSIVVFLGAATYFVVVGRRAPGREESVCRDGHGPERPAATGADRDDRSSTDVGQVPGEPLLR